MTKRIFMLLAVLLLVAMQMPVSAQSISSASFDYSFNGKDYRVTCPASGLDVVDLTGTVAENLKINGVSVQTSGSVTSVTMYAANYKSGEKDPDDIVEVPLVAQESQPGDEYVWWYIPTEFIERMDDGYLVKDNNKSAATRYFSFYFVANKDNNPIYYNNGGSYYSIRYKTDDGQGGGGQSGDITFYDKNTATLNLAMTGGWSSNITYTYAGDGSRDISDQPGGVNSLEISGFTLRLQRSDAGLNIGDVSVQYKVYEEGSDGQWNRLDFTFEEDEDGNILNKKYTCTSSTKNLAAGLSPGKNYVLEIMYQVVDNNGQYYFLKPSKDYRMFKFSVKDGGEGGEGGVRGDVNGDGEVGMPDVMFIIQKILTGKFPDEE